MTAGRQRKGMGPVVVYSVLLVVLVVLIATLAFTARQPPPPQIAELTPQAQHQISKAPNQLSSNQGSGLGGLGGTGPGGTTTTTTPAAVSTLPGGTGPITVPAAHHCYGNPPMQLSFDTQSPPCVAFWEGNNGGATSNGVTGTTIRICIAKGAQGQTASRIQGDLLNFFNSYFELYGRIEEWVGCGGYGGQTTAEYCATMESGADAAAQSGHFFAVNDQDTNDPACFLEGMARNHVISVGELAWYGQQTMSSYAPYLWAYPEALDHQFASIGKLLCSMANQDASYSPDPVTAGTKRKFGLINQYDETPDPPQGSWMSDAMKSCGQSLMVENLEEQQYTNGTQSDEYSATYQQEEENAILQMRQAGVTTIVCSCLILDEEVFPAYASQQAYHPEWLLEGGANDYNWVVKADWPNADQQKALLGITFIPPQLPYADMTLNEALAAVDPGGQDDEPAEVDANQLFYEQMLLITSCIQMAGPDLTPQTFERGCQEAHFPNPYSPELEGVASFQGGSNSMTQDAALMWWSDAAQDVHNSGNGTWCYVDGGRRFSLANWPKSDPYPPNLTTAPCWTTPVLPPTP